MLLERYDRAGTTAYWSQLKEPQAGVKPREDGIGNPSRIAVFPLSQGPARPLVARRDRIIQ